MPSKRSHGEGTLRHRSDGRWELRMMDGYQKDGSPRFKTFYGKTQKEVKLKLKEYQDALISGVQLDTADKRILILFQFELDLLLSLAIEGLEARRTIFLVAVHHT